MSSDRNKIIEVNSYSTFNMDDLAAFKEAQEQYVAWTEQEFDETPYAPGIKLVSKEFVGKEFGDDPFFRWIFECRWDGQ